jgi:hypothetical protein
VKYSKQELEALREGSLITIPGALLEVVHNDQPFEQFNVKVLQGEAPRIVKYESVNQIVRRGYKTSDILQQPDPKFNALIEAMLAEYGQGQRIIGDAHKKELIDYFEIHTLPKNAAIHLLHIVEAFVQGEMARADLTERLRNMIDA